MEERTVTIIKADAGFVVLRPLHGANPERPYEETYQEPVIAWEIVRKVSARGVHALVAAIGAAGGRAGDYKYVDSMLREWNDIKDREIKERIRQREEREEKERT